MVSCEGRTTGAQRRDATVPSCEKLHNKSIFKLIVAVTNHTEVFESEGLSTQGSRPGRTAGEAVGG